MDEMISDETPIARIVFEGSNPRIQRRLRWAGLQTAGQVRETPDHILLQEPGFGRRCLRYVRAKLPRRLTESQQLLVTWGMELQRSEMIKRLIEYRGEEISQTIKAEAADARRNAGEIPFPLSSAPY